jgi:hypothetical protein
VGEFPLTVFRSGKVIDAIHNDINRSAFPRAERVGRLSAMERFRTNRALDEDPLKVLVMIIDCFVKKDLALP